MAGDEGAVEASPTGSSAVEKPAVTGRPNDIAPGSKVGNSTFAERAKARGKAVKVDEAENKAVSSRKASKK